MAEEGGLDKDFAEGGPCKVAEEGGLDKDFAEDGPC